MISNSKTTSGNNPVSKAPTKPTTRPTARPAARAGSNARSGSTSRPGSATKAAPRPDIKHASRPAAPSTGKKTDLKRTPSGSPPPQEKSQLSQEAREARPTTGGSIPDFAKSFGSGGAADKAALAGRVIAGQTAATNGGARTPEQKLAVRSLGGLGGVGAAGLAAKNVGDALDPSKSAKERTLAGLSGAASTAHAIHGTTQVADLGRDLAGKKPLNAPVKTPGAANLSEWGSKLGKAAGDVASADKGKLLAQAARGVTVGSTVEHLADAGKLTQAAGRVAQVAGRAAPLLGGVAQIASGGTDLVQNGASFDNVSSTISGGAKLVGAGLIASGVGAPVGAALIAGSTAFDLGKLAWDNRAAIGSALQAAARAVPGLGALGF